MNEVSLLQKVECGLATLTAQCNTGYIQGIASELNDTFFSPWFINQRCATNQLGVPCYAIAEQHKQNLVEVMQECLSFLPMSQANPLPSQCSNSCSSAVQRMEQALGDCSCIFSQADFGVELLTFVYALGLQTDFNFFFKVVHSSCRALIPIGCVHNLGMSIFPSRQNILESNLVPILANYVCRNSSNLLNNLTSTCRDEYCIGKLFNFCKERPDGSLCGSSSMMVSFRKIFTACNTVLRFESFATLYTFNASVPCPGLCHDTIQNITQEMGCCWSLWLDILQILRVRNPFERLLSHCNIMISDQTECPTTLDVNVSVQSSAIDIRVSTLMSLVVVIATFIYSTLSEWKASL